jgi:hypothetical protein
LEEVLGKSMGPTGEKLAKVTGPREVLWTCRAADLAKNREADFDWHALRGSKEESAQSSEAIRGSLALGDVSPMPRDNVGSDNIAESYRNITPKKKRLTV